MEVLLPSGRRPLVTHHPSESVELILPWHNCAQTTLRHNENNFFKAPFAKTSHTCPIKGRIYALLATFDGAYLT